MPYKEQKEKWLNEHPNATLAEAWENGYTTCTDNWCNRQR